MGSYIVNFQLRQYSHSQIFPQPVRQPKARNAEITSRLSRLEKLVNSIGYDPNTFEKQPAQASSPESIARSSDSGIERGLQNLQVKEYQPISKTDGRRYLSSDFWSSLSGEVGLLLLDQPLWRLTLAAGRWFETAS